MKRLVLMLATAATLAVATPFSATLAFARDDDDRRGGAQRQERGGDRGGPRRGDGDGRRYVPVPRAPQGDRGGPPRRFEEQRSGPRGDDAPRGRAPVLGYGDGPARRYEEPRPRYEERPRYDAPQPRYGEGAAPPRARGFAPAAPPSGARRGGYLPRNFNGEIVDDYRRYRLRTPPAGFAWVRMGNGFALVSMRDGQVFDVVQ